MKYKKGDVVRVKKGLEAQEMGEPEGNYFVTVEMSAMSGSEAVIEKAFSDYYRLSVDSLRFCWTDQMLEPLTDERGLPIFETDKPEKFKPLPIHTKEGGFPAFKTDPPDNGLPHTPHYMNGLIETIDVIKMALTPEEFRGFLKGNVLKYQIRAPHKNETPDEDYQKAKDYYDLLEGLE